MIVDWRPPKPTRVDKCPTCGEMIEAGVRIYLNDVVIENGTVVDYTVAFSSHEGAVADAVTGDGAGFHDLDVYCANCGDLEHLFIDTVAS